MPWAADNAWMISNSVFSGNLFLNNLTAPGGSHAGVPKVFKFFSNADFVIKAFGIPIAAIPCSFISCFCRVFSESIVDWVLIVVSLSVS